MVNSIKNGLKTNYDDEKNIAQLLQKYCTFRTRFLPFFKFLFREGTHYQVEHVSTVVVKNNIFKPHLLHFSFKISIKVLIIFFKALF